MYDGAGQRVLRRSTDGSTTSLTVYAFGREEHVYTSTGSNQGNTYYYTLAGHLLGKSDGGSTTFYQTDLLGSVVADWSNTAGSAALKGNEVYGPYGKQRYHQGTQGTPKGFTGQYNDALTGLDYYNARYYDPVVGVFLSADSVQGNMAGMNPYAYVGGNPETDTDPTGQYYFSPAFILANGLGGGTVPGAGPYRPPPSTTYVGGRLPFLQQHSSFPPTTPVLTPAAPPNVLSTASHSSTTIPITQINSCNVPGPSGQALCGNWGVNFAVYSPTGAELALPGSWCLDCGFGGGSNNSGESGSSNGLLNGWAADAEGEASGEAGAAGDAAGSETGGIQGSNKTTLYRAVDVPELNDVLHLGDYNLAPSEGGKYFSFSEEGTRQFAESSFNAGRKMTITSVEVPNSILEKGYRFFDPGGGNDSIHFADEVLPELYGAMDLPKILDAPWVPLIGR